MTIQEIWRNRLGILLIVLAAQVLITLQFDPSLSGKAKLIASLIPLIGIYVAWTFSQGSLWSRLALFLGFSGLFLVMAALTGFFLYAWMTGTFDSGELAQYLPFDLTYFLAFLALNLLTVLWVTLLIARFLRALGKVENHDPGFDLTEWLQKNAFFTGIIFNAWVLLNTVPILIPMWQRGLGAAPSPQELNMFPIAAAYATQYALAWRLIEFVTALAAGLSLAGMAALLVAARGRGAIIWGIRIQIGLIAVSGVLAYSAVYLTLPRDDLSGAWLSALLNHAFGFGLMSLCAYWLSDAFVFAFQPKTYLSDFVFRRFRL